MFKKFRRESVFEAAGLELVAEPEALEEPAAVFSIDDNEIASSSNTGIGNIEGSGAFRNALEEKCDSLVGSLFLVPLFGACGFCCPFDDFAFPFFCEDILLDYVRRK
jgi:hypothetical protein